MITITTNNKESELKEYCQKWLALLAANDFTSAFNLIDSPNCYGLNWRKKEIIEVLNDYYGESIEFDIQNHDIANCEPNYLERNDGGLLYDFNLPINGELTDLTVQFEFNPMQNSQFKVVIHDIHVL